MTNKGRLAQKRENVPAGCNQVGGRRVKGEGEGELLFKSKISNRHSTIVNGFWERCALLGGRIDD